MRNGFLLILIVCTLGYLGSRQGCFGNTLVCMYIPGFPQSIVYTLLNTLHVDRSHAEGFSVFFATCALLLPFRGTGGMRATWQIWVCTIGLLGYQTWVFRSYSGVVHSVCCVPGFPEYLPYRACPWKKQIRPQAEGLSVFLPLSCFFVIFLGGRGDAGTSTDEWFVTVRY